jgi:lipid II:glycine glycyltransferase (peptidoglycan interpeptide bridge formation enzyme)
MQHPLNSIEWAKYKNNLDHWSILDIDGIPIVFKNIPLLGKLGLLYMFPIVETNSLIEKSCQDLYELFEKSKVDYLIVKPFLLIKGKDFQSQLSKILPDNFLIDWLSNTTLGYRDTFVIDLSRGIEECFKSFSSTKRNEIRRIEKSADLSIDINEKIDWDEFYAHYNNNLSAKGAPVLAKERVNFIFNTFNDEDGLLLIRAINKADNSHFYTGCLLKDKIGFYLFGAYDRSKNILSKMVPKYTLYLTIKKMIELGLSHFDLGGIDLTDPKKSGINDFKKGFGGILSSCDSFFLTRKENKLKSNFIKLILKLKGV